MTNAEIIEKIRAEVNRLKEEHQVPTFRGDDYEEGGVNGYQLALDKVLAKLDTLQEQPVCEELEKEISRYLREDCSDDDEPSISEIARHFAQWGAEHLDK